MASLAKTAQTGIGQNIRQNAGRQKKIEYSVVQANMGLKNCNGL